MDIWIVVDEALNHVRWDSEGCTLVVIGHVHCVYSELLMVPIVGAVSIVVVVSGVFHCNIV